MNTAIRRQLLLQALMVAVASAVFLALFDRFAALSVWFGGGIAALNGVLQARCLQRDQQAPERTPERTLAAAVICLLQRFVAVALLFIVGLSIWRLDPLAVLVGFIIGQFVLVISATRQLTQK